MKEKNYVNSIPDLVYYNIKPLHVVVLYILLFKVIFMKYIILTISFLFLLITNTFALENKQIYLPTDKDKKIINKIEQIVETKFNTEKKLKLLINKAYELRYKKINPPRSYYLFNSIINIAEKKLSSINPDYITITIIDDKRCKTCSTKEITNMLLNEPWIKDANFIYKDFSDKWVKQYLSLYSSSMNLPIFIFSNNNYSWATIVNNDGNIIKDYLETINDSEYYLPVWAEFNPFEKRSDRGFKLVDKEKLKEIKKDSYIKWNKEAQITWLEYSDLECPFCAKLHTDGTKEKALYNYSTDLNIIFQHFPLIFHDNAQKAWELAECLWKQKWSDAFYSLISKSFELWQSDTETLLDEAEKLWWNKTNLQKCLDNDEFSLKVKSQQNKWVDIFDIAWTPGNILINNKTWEYINLSWAYPYEDFKEAIDKLLK